MMNPFRHPEPLRYSIAFAVELAHLFAIDQVDLGALVGCDSR
jgi:hypothetical protein